MCRSLRYVLFTTVRKGADGKSGAEWRKIAGVVGLEKTNTDNSV